MEELRQTNQTLAQRVENLETIVVSQTWNAVNAPAASDAERQQRLAAVRPPRGPRAGHGGDEPPEGGRSRPPAGRVRREMPREAQAAGDPQLQVATERGLEPRAALGLRRPERRRKSNFADALDSWARSPLGAGGGGQEEGRVREHLLPAGERGQREDPVPSSTGRSRRFSAPSRRKSSRTFDGPFFDHRLQLRKSSELQALRCSLRPFRPSLNGPARERSVSSAVGRNGRLRAR